MNRCKYRAHFVPDDDGFGWCSNCPIGVRARTKNDSCDQYETGKSVGLKKAITKMNELINLYAMDREEEILKVDDLCKQIGYGNVMDIASRLWQRLLEKQGLPPEAAHVPCVVTENHVYTKGVTYVNLDRVLDYIYCKWDILSELAVEDFRNKMEE